MDEEHRRRISEARKQQERMKRLRAIARPEDLEKLEEDGELWLGFMKGVVAEALSQAETELGELIDSYGGFDALGEPKRALLHDYAALGLMMRVAMRTFMRSGDQKSLDQVARLVSERRQTLRLLGIEDPEDEPRSLEDIIADGKPGR